MYEQSNIMIVRGFLFLLAILTGVSAAQAAGNQQFAPSAIGSTTESAAAQNMESVFLVRMHRASATYLSLDKQYGSVPKALYFPALKQLIVTTATQRSDRTRE